MRAVLLASLIALGALACRAPAHAQGTAPAAEMDPTLKKLSTLVGGKWVSDGKQPNGTPVAELTFKWTEDGKSIVGDGVLLPGTAKPVYTQVRFGWDAAAKKVYYLDAHGPHEVYFGHVRLEGEELVYEFRTIVGRPSNWVMRESYPTPDTCRSTVNPVVDGKISERGHQINLKRIR